MMNGERHGKWQKAKVKWQKSHFCDLQFAICHVVRSSSGQAMTEMVILIPLLVLLTGGAAAVVYACMQGLKVQQAANLVARIQGQERVAGGFNLQTIQRDNGISGNTGDQDPTKQALDSQTQNWRSMPKAQPTRGTVYAKIKDAVHSFFDTSDAPDLFIPQPKYGSVGYSDQIKVIRVWDPPQIFGFKIPPITLSATAYGGEDSHMYGLVRWGSTTVGSFGNNGKFWSQSDGRGRHQNLQNPSRD